MGGVEAAACVGDGGGLGGVATGRVELACVRTPRLGRPSERTAAVGIQFGLSLFGAPTTIVPPAGVALAPGRIVLLLGPSGGGKSSALSQIERHFAGVCRVDRVAFPRDAAIIDAVAPWGAWDEAASMLTLCGLGEARLWLRRFAELSDGERFRARLARGVALQARGGQVTPLLCDEFCSILHRRAAKAISHNLRKLARRRGLSIVVASSNEDIVDDLQPSTIVRLGGCGTCEVEPREARNGRVISFRRRLRIEPGSKRDYDAFSAMHYRATDELGFVDKVFVMREGTGGDPLGIVVYAHGPLELSLRNKATDSRFVNKPHLLNRSMRILRRLVIHPDVRGCGLGHYLVRRTLPLVGTPFVECLASMGQFNPVFERGGMRRIGQYDVSPACRRALKLLAAIDVDPAGRDFPARVCRSRRVRRIVSEVVYRWYARTTVGGEHRVKRQSPQFLAQTFRGLIGSRPVYYLWERPAARSDRAASPRRSRKTSKRATSRKKGRSKK